MKHFLTFLFAVLFLVACGGDEQGTAEKKAATSAPEKTMQPAMKSSESMGSDKMMVVDHARDEIEFELRRSLNGVKRMIEQYKQDGYDTAELEAKKQKLEKDLQEFLSQ